MKARPIICEACGAPVRTVLLGTERLERCPSCSHLQRPEPAAAASIRTHAWGGDAGLDVVRLALCWFRMRAGLALPERARVLEIGFGAGALLARFRRAGYEVAGIEPGWLGCELHPELTGITELRSGRAEDLLDAAAAFDAIYGIHVIEHVAMPAEVFRRSLRALRPGGRLYLLTPDAESQSLAWAGCHWWNLEDPTHIRFFSASSITRMLEAAGFRDVRVRRPWLDSVIVEPASLARAILARHRTTHGILGHPVGRLLTASFLPATVLARLVLPRLRPTLEVVAERPR